ncbi:FKBP-type peptidyl-prolyl cis-trans isomerase [Polaribacter sp. KT25b]|uniref:FKBP-type peptidyl-prolyl cis-trans isomerase n=1 Tax=Polaribacter sp. KT25b TaxID=1855336 RepID=UPI00087BF769|nr:FKBP-type peptidyl-prolyl cis-trans isomerase [Polaribacter sp. KT25b]SDR72333.1 FKBP-type peptidyl-prolyl cis-trans isomerase [Polaribacter sp. KT25b]
MKSYLYLFFSLILFTACLNDDDSNFNPETEEDIIQYINDNSLNATRTDSGLYYIINNEGTGNYPAENSVIDVVYTGYFLDGTVFDQNDSGIINLNQVIEGLKEGFQLFREGGEGKLIIPYELAFGVSGNYSGSIPGGAVLIFDIKITAIYENYKAQNDAAILQYIDDNDLIATKTASGLYYVIDDEGTGERPTSTSNVTVDYKGYFLNGTVFDESRSTGVSFGLDQVIAGWTEGITYFKEGGEGKLLIPYYLGYGEELYNYTIPGYSVLIFDVKLISIDD